MVDLSASSWPRSPASAPRIVTEHRTGCGTLVFIPGGRARKRCLGLLHPARAGSVEVEADCREAPARASQRDGCLISGQRDAFLKAGRA